MNRIVFLERLSPWGKFLMFLGIIILSSIFAALFGLLMGKIILGVDLQTLSDYVSNPKSDTAVSFLKFYQLVNQIGIFIVPVFVFSFLIHPSIPEYLSLNRKPQTLVLLVSGLMIYTILPFNHYLGELNSDMSLPAFLSGIEDWMKEYEEKATLLTKSFLKADSINVLLINIFIVALVPAIGEELLFRGVILILFKEITKNVHLAIIISAFLFAALHLQFFSFLPRFVLGIMLGYVFVISGSIWVPIFAHFVNNASSVIIFYLNEQKQIDVPMKDFGSMPHPAYIIGSLLITLWLMIIIYRKSRFLGFK